MKTTGIANTGPSALEVLSTPELARDLLPPTHPDGPRRMTSQVYRFLDDPSTFAVAGGNGTDGRADLVAHR